MRADGAPPAAKSDITALSAKLLRVNFMDREPFFTNKYYSPQPKKAANNMN